MTNFSHHTLVFPTFPQTWWKKCLILAISYIDISRFSPTMVEEMFNFSHFIHWYFKIFSNHCGRNDWYQTFHILIFQDFFQPSWKKWLIVAISYIDISKFSPTMVEEMTDLRHFIYWHFKISPNMVEEKWLILTIPYIDISIGFVTTIRVLIFTSQMLFTEFKDLSLWTPIAFWDDKQCRGNFAATTSYLG